MTRVGIEIEVESASVSTDHIAGAIEEGQLTGWELDLNEHSLRGGTLGWEIKTTGSGIDIDSVWPALAQLYPIVRNSTGSWRAAVHTHVNVSDIGWAQRALALGLGYAVDRSIFEMVSPERVESNFCVPLDHKANEVLSAIRSMARMRSPRPYGKYSSININPMTEIGTIEFRHMKTPASGETIESVTEMLTRIHRFVNAASEVINVTAYVPAPQTPAELVKAFFALASNKFIWDRVGLRVDPEAALSVAITLSEASALGEYRDEDNLGISEHRLNRRSWQTMLETEAARQAQMREEEMALEQEEHESEDEEEMEEEWIDEFERTEEDV